MAESWRSPFAAATEIKSNAKELDYTYFVRGIQVLLLGDEHSNTSIYIHLIDFIPHLKQAGVTHLGIEIPSKHQKTIARYAEGDQRALDNVDIGPVKNIKDIIGAAAREDLQVVAIDVEQTLGLTQEERDMSIADNIVANVQNMRSDAKMAVLMGSFHLGRGQTVAAGIVEARGIRVRRVFFAGGHMYSRFIIDAAAREANMDQRMFVVNLEGYTKYVPYGGDADYVVHLPQRG